MAKSLVDVAAKVVKVLFENDKVRVVEMTWRKGTKAPMHTHPAYFAYAMTPVVYRSTSPDGKTEKRILKKSEVDWSEGETHSVEALGKLARLLVVELK